MSAGTASTEYLVSWNLGKLCEYKRLKKTDPAAAQALWEANDRENRALGIEADKIAEKERVDRAEREARMEAVWNACPPAPPSHPYLRKHGIKPHGARLYGNDLIVRMNNDAGKMDSLLLLGKNNGDDAATKSLGSPYSHCIIGDIADPKWSGKIYIALKYSSGANIHEATGAPVMVARNPKHAFDLLVHARQEYNHAELILCLESPLTEWDDHMDEACCAVAKFGSGLAILPEGVNTWTELRRRYGQKGVFICANNSTNLPEDWKSNFQSLMDSLKKKSSSLLAPKETLQLRRYPLLTATALSEAPLAQYRVKNVFPREGLAAIFGPPGVAKSFLALDLAFAISDGDDWCGYRVKECDVLCLCLEGQGGLAQRVQAYRKHNGQDTGKRIRFITVPFSLLCEDDVDALIATIKEARIRDGVIIIDTLSAASPGADENSSVDMGKLLQALKRIHEDFGGLVILVHHSGKDTQKGLRGHSSLLAALDAVIEVKRDEDRRSWRLVKSKDGLDGKEHPFRLSVVELDIDDDGDPINSCVIEPEERAVDSVRGVKLPKGGNQKTVYDVAGELLRKSVHFGEGGASAERPCIRLDDLIAACRGRLAVEEDRIPERVRLAVTGLINNGCIIFREGWLRDP